MNLPAVITEPDVAGGVSVVELTGEIVTLEAASEAALGRAYMQYRTAQDELRSFKHQLDSELVRRADFNATQHIDMDGYGRVLVDPPTDEEVWDTRKLREVLMKLINEEEISSAAARTALKKQVTWKVQAQGIKNLRKLGGYVQASVDACCEMHPPARRSTRLSSRS